MNVRFHPSLNEELRSRLGELGVAEDAHSLVGLMAPGCTLPRDGAEQQEPIAWISLVDDEHQAMAALAAGATDAVVPPYEVRTLDARIGAQLRQQRAWRRRLQAQQRQARRTTEELASAQDLLARLIEATPNPVMAVDRRGRVLVFNRAAEQALGYDAEFARSQMHVTSIYANPDDAREVLATLRSNESGAAQGIQVRLRTRWGEQIPVELSAAEVRDATGELVATVGVFQDKRDHLALMARLDATTEQLIAAEHRNAAIAKAAEAAFEINQPLTALMGTIEMLEMEPGLSERTIARLSRAQFQLDRIRAEVRAFTRISRTPESDSGNDSLMSDLLRLSEKT